MKLCECGCGEPAPIAKRARPGFKVGDPQRFRLGHHCRVVTTRGYRQVTIPKTRERPHEHRMRAELALGHPLPERAVVHHVDGNRDGGPLVICQDQAYHKLLHLRMLVRDHGGNPNTDLYCSICEMCKPVEAFKFRTAAHAYHERWCRDCRNERQRK